MRFPMMVVVLSAALFPGYVIAQELPVDKCLGCQMQELVKPIAETHGVASLWRIKQVERLLLKAAVQQQQQAAKASWVRRHPVLAGTLIGAGAGAAVYGAACPPLFFAEGGCDSAAERAGFAAWGAAGGAFWGAVIGWVVGS
jgi:hypothetical protein